MKNALLLPGQLPRLTWLHLTSFDYIHRPPPLEGHRHPSRVLVLLGHCVALAFGHRIFCFPFTSSNWIKLPRFRRALCFFVAAAAKFFPPENAASVTLFFRSLSPPPSLSLTFYLSLPFTNSQLCTKLSRKEKIIGHKKCHSTKK